MAQYDVWHSCGHMEHVSLFGKMTERDRAMTRMEQQECHECYVARRTAEAQADAEREALPTLTGTEKQVAWALSIRQTALASLDQAFIAHTASVLRRFGVLTPEELPDEQRAQYASGMGKIQASVAALKRQTEARYWIDRRHLSGREWALEAGKLTAPVAV